MRTAWRPTLWGTPRAATSSTAAATSAAATRTGPHGLAPARSPPAAPSSSVAGGGRRLPATARASTAAMRGSPFTRAAAGESTARSRPPTRATSVAWRTDVSPSEGSTWAM